MANNSCLITGGYGLIGSALANAVDGKVTILTRSDKHKERIIKKGVKVIKKDLIDINEGDVEKQDIIYHCASTVDNYHILTDPFVDVETNIKGMIKLLEVCKNLPKKPKIFFFSTFFIYGNIYDQTKEPITEKSRTEPLALYPATKLCAESILKLYSRLYGIPYVICRITNVYDEHEDYNNKKKGALNYMIMQAIKGEPLSIYRGGNFYRDYVSLNDVIDAVQFLESKKVVNDTYLIGRGKPVLFRDMINYIHKLTGKKSEIREIEPPEFHKVVGIANFVADTSKINKLGWKSKIDYRKGIKKIVCAYADLISANKEA